MTIIQKLAAANAPVAVLAGGPGAEREVSLASGKETYIALQQAGLDAEMVIVPPDDPGACLENLDCRIAVLMLHGEYGEDGQAQRVLEHKGIAYTGSGPEASALAMDKNESKIRFADHGLPTAKWVVVQSAAEAAQALEKAGLSYPLFVKPNFRGSSVGVSRVDASTQLRAAVDVALAEDAFAMIEEMVVGRELTVPWLDGQVLPVIELRATSVFYDYHAKYQSEETRYLCPADLPSATTESIGGMVRAAVKALGVRDIGRVDLMLGADGPKILELNTLPGFTRHSLVPLSARTAGTPMTNLCLKLVEMAARRIGIE